VRALELAYRYLSRRERTVREVRQYLLGRDLDSTAVEAALVELTECGYLDDARYARIFAQDRRALEQWGNARIRRALLARGIQRDLVEEALREEAEVDRTLGGGLDRTLEFGVDRTLGEGVDRSLDVDFDPRPDGELGRALALLERRFPSPPSDRRERQRAMGVLIRRGYEPELASDALAAYSRTVD
jgi:regulatory protein